MTQLYRIISFVFLLFFSGAIFSQGEAKKWYFGSQAGLDFNTSPPTVLINGVMQANYACASIADAAGNLLFYTDGGTVYNQAHVAMANGTGLMGNNLGNGGQNVIIIKKPGSSTVYYVITGDDAWSLSTGLYYSEVDMTLAAGNGSVTVKNALIAPTTNSISIGKLTATRHCNGTDVWLVGRESYYGWGTTTTFTLNNSFRAFLITPAGINLTPVVSTPVTYTVNNNWGWGWDPGAMKISPNGKKLAAAVSNWGSWNSNTNMNLFELFDFNNTSGVVSNSVGLVPFLQTTFNNQYGFGVEFSPDGTKLYGSAEDNTTLNSGRIYQWDICAGSATAIAASQYTVYNVPNSSNYVGCLQVAPDGKIYSSTYFANSLGVINNPNAAGAACNYVPAAQSVSPKSCTYSLPNFMSSYLVAHPPPSPFTFTVSNGYGCQAALFNSTYNPSVTSVGCAASGYSLTNMLWKFGDPASGAANTSTLQSPIHAFTSLGTYSVELILYYSCGGGTDTLKQVVNVNQPCISVTSNTITCANLGSATVAATSGVGPFSYTWMPTGQTNSVATGLSPGSYTITVFDQGNNFTYTASTVFTSLIPLTGNLNNSSSITCNGATTGSANVTNLAGGSGSENYLWFNGAVTHTVPHVTTLSAGLWSVTVTDALTGCTINQSFYIAQPPAMNLVLSSSTPTACAGKTAVLSGTNSGGTPALIPPAYTYSWTGGPSTNTRTVSQAVAGTYTYTLNSRDSLNCLISKTISVTFVQNPLLVLSSASICPSQTAAIIVSGAATYTWNTGLTGNILTDSPVVTTGYFVTGSALGCTSTANASIILKPVPFPMLSTNSPKCDGDNIMLSGYGGVSYSWAGPLSYTSIVQHPVISLASPASSGIYTVIVTAANGCTASTTSSVTVHPSPTVSAAGSTICVNQPLNLSASAIAGATYTWTGPGNYFSVLQNPSIASPVVANSGTYTIKVKSAAGCTSSAVADVTVTAMPVAQFTNNGPLCYGSTLTLSGNGGDSYSWTGPNGFSSTLQNPMIANVTVPASGNYNLHVTVGPCINTVTHSVTIHPLPVFSISSNTPCVSKPLNLSGSSVPNATLYFWQGPGTYGSTSQNPVRPSSVMGYGGNYTLTVTDINSCKSTAVHSVVILKNPELTTASRTVCLNAGALLEVSGASTYTWSGPGSYQNFNANAAITSATNVAVTIYTVVGMAANSCTAIANASLTTLSLPLPALQVIPSNTVCLNKVIKLDGLGGVNYEWHGPGNYKQAVKTLTLLAGSVLYAGTYTLIVIDAKGCVSHTSTEISINPLPNGSLLGTIMDACVPFSSDFNFYSAASTSTLVTAEWQINDEPKINSKTFSRTFKTAGEYLIKGNFKDTLTGCVNTATFAVNARPIPVADFAYQPAKPVEGLDDVVFTNTSKGEELNKWSWHFVNNDGQTSLQKNTSYFFRDAGNYPVAMVVKNIWGCSDTIVKEIQVEPDFNLFVPNIFTPNGDGDNEVFLPVATGIKSFELGIYDRWGRKVFQSNDITRGWDGTLGGELCKSEVYIWRIRVSSKSGEAKELNGHVTLYR